MFVVLVRSALVRAVGLAIANFLAAKGFIEFSHVSQVAEDIIYVLSFVAGAAYLGIWQWRHTHPAKAHLDVVLPVAEGEAQHVEAIRRDVLTTLRGFIHRIADALVEKPKNS